MDRKPHAEFWSDSPSYEDETHYTNNTMRIAGAKNTLPWARHLLQVLKITVFFCTLLVFFLTTDHTLCRHCYGAGDDECDAL